MASRFEELGVKEAAEVEALLGPLAEAIFVDDPRAAAQSLSHLTNKPPSVWLVGGEATLPLDADVRPTGEILGNDVLVSGSAGWRISRIPDGPTLGRRSRERRIAELTKAVAESGEHVERLEARLRDLGVMLDASDGLLSEVETIERGDPTSALENVLAEIASASEQERRFSDAAGHTQREIDALIPRRKSLWQLLPSAWLLEVGSHSKASMSQIRRQALQDVLLTHDGIIRLRPSTDLGFNVRINIWTRVPSRRCWGK